MSKNRCFLISLPDLEGKYVMLSMPVTMDAIPVLQALDALKLTHVRINEKTARSLIEHEEPRVAVHYLNEWEGYLRGFLGLLEGILSLEERELADHKPKIPFDTVSGSVPKRTRGILRPRYN